MSDVNYEKAVLCVALEVQDAFAQVTARLEPEDFSDPQHQSVWRALKSLLSQGYEEADPVRLQEMIDTGKLSVSTDYLVELREYLPKELGWYDYRGVYEWQDRIADRARLRNIEGQLGRALSTAREPDATTDDVLSGVLDIIVSESQGRDVSGFRPLPEAFTEFRPVLQDWLEGKAPNKVPTGFRDLDAMLGGGLPRGNLTVIGGRPGSFKTAMSFRIAQNVAERLKEQGGGSIAYASLEMTKTELIKRAVCADAHVDAVDLEQGKLNPQQRQRVMEAADHIETLDTFKVYDGLATSDFLHYQTLLMMAQEDVHLLVIDFAELIADAGKSEVERVSRIFRVARDIAKVRDIPVVLLSQLNRSVEEEPSKVPQLHNLKLGGEDVPALVMMMYYPYMYEMMGEYVRVPKSFGYQQYAEYDREEDSNKKHAANRSRIYVVIPKNRYGPTGEIKFNVVPSWTLIRDYDPRSEDGGVVRLIAKNSGEDHDF